ncbi:hypothetical protein ALTERO38_20124 [Alteromonas sp. 38]|nr:hypothetical protein ALTER154_100415 [Alteromonas sp. 154]VXA98196.1 hypothetical protein ALTERO38_20124 [Alteromonas sp. 38]
MIRYCYTRVIVSILYKARLDLDSVASAGTDLRGAHA